MKLLTLSVIILFFSCSEKEVQNNNVPSRTIEVKPINTVQNEKNNSPENWLNFYRTINPEFKLDNFKPNEIQTVNFSETSTLAKFDKNFNHVYEPFLIYSPDKTKYLDFDSYNWSIAEDGNPGFEADQEVMLVNLNAKTKYRIAYFGPSYRIEDGYWKSDSKAVLLGNSDENIPFCIEMNFENKKSQYFMYQDTLQSTAKYRQIRLQNLGLKLN